MLGNIIKRKRGGYILLMGLLVVVILGIIIYYARRHGPVYEFGKGESDINPPWRQWHKMNVRFEKGETIGKPTAEQPQINKTLYVSADCFNNEAKKCGDARFFFKPDGTVEGGWGASFYLSKDIHFQVMACKFKGNIDPKEIFSDEKGPDFSRLFFITKGHFSILETNSENGRVRNVMGEAYLRGWMNKDYSVEGDLVITSDAKNFYRYTWKAKQRKTCLQFSSYKSSKENIVLV